MTSANHASISSSVEGTFRAHKYTYQRMSTEMDWNQTDCLDGFQCSAFSPDMGALGMIISCMATARMTLQVRLQHDVQLSDVHMYEAFGQNVSCRWGTGPASIRSSTSTTVEVQVRFEPLGVYNWRLDTHSLRVSMMHHIHVCFLNLS